MSQFKSPGHRWRDGNGAEAPCAGAGQSCPEQVGLWTSPPFAPHQAL